MGRHKLADVSRLLIFLFSLFDFAPLANSRNYDYMLFENFVLNEANFKSEIQMVANLKVYRNYLHKIKDSLTNLLDEKVENSNSLECANCNETESESEVILERKVPLVLKPRSDKEDLKKMLKTNLEQKKIGRMQMNNLVNFLGDHEKNVYGAMRALIMLQETYKFDVLEMAEGRVYYKGKKFQGDARLDAIDLMNIATVSYEEKWYDSCVWFLKAAKELYNKTKETLDNNLINPARLQLMSESLVKIQNSLIVKRKKRAGVDFKLLPYLIDENLDKKKSQPKMFKKIDFFTRNSTDPDEYQSGDLKEDGFRRVCRGELKGVFEGNYTQPSVPRCHLLHQNDPYLVLAPFKLEVYLIKPYRVVFHDFLSEKEINWMVEYSKPRMSRNRGISTSNDEGSRHEFREGKRVRTVHKTVQVWFNDIEFNEEPTFDFDKKYVNPMKDVYGNKVAFPIINKLSMKIGWATRMNITSRWASSQYQTTNYGLGGLCETHLDPHGYIDGTVVTRDKVNLFMTGDMIATFMAWLDDVPAGGGTGFDYPNKEMLVEAERGAAAFWMDLNAAGSRENVATHGGCPVLIGSKWILNKWLYSFDQWDSYPCHLNRDDFIDPFPGYYRSVEATNQHQFYSGKNTENI